ncbi:hypothetical protein MRY16398_06580 [Phytobacter sp. MRY16-398]|nr:hypothetical protein C9415_16295 [Kluyvera sp. Nf5]BBE75602.1 hypothetical protein MRY16398_06580 [Phytobacter sp. MRY16-398]
MACHILLRAKGSNFVAGGSSLRCVYPKDFELQPHNGGSKYNGYKHPVAGRHSCDVSETLPKGEDPIAPKACG